MELRRFDEVVDDLATAAMVRAGPLDHGRHQPAMLGEHADDDRMPALHALIVEQSQRQVGPGRCRCAHDQELIAPFELAAKCGLEVGRHIVDCDLGLVCRRRPARLMGPSRDHHTMNRRDVHRRTQQTHQAAELAARPFPCIGIVFA